MQNCIFLTFNMLKFLRTGTNKNLLEPASYKIYQGVHALSIGSEQYSH